VKIQQFNEQCMCNLAKVARFQESTNAVRIANQIQVEKFFAYCWTNLILG
jgi:hypothetical protein